MTDRMPRYLFVTGKLAAPSLTATLEGMGPDFNHEIAVLNITVAALMNTEWIARHVNGVRDFDAVIIPGLCRGDEGVLEKKLGVPVVRGPKDLKDLPVHFGGKRDMRGYGEYTTRILAEIVDAHEIGLEAILARAAYYRDSGADIIDLGCPPSGGFKDVGRAVAALREQGFTVSVDTFDTETIIQADRAGVDMLLSVNSQNLEIAREIKAKVVVIPDFGKGIESLERNARRLTEWGAPHILDPILDPIGFGFTESVRRFKETRDRHPDAEMLMGLGNLTELTDADTTGLNALLAGIMAELDIGYALTTEVAAHATGAVRELDRARRLMRYAVANKILPKNLSADLLTVKEPAHAGYSEAELRRLHEQVRDKNFRIFVAGGAITVFNRELFIQDTDPQRIFDRLGVQEPGHAFYLGRELERAALALKLGKKYVQEQGLSFGYLTADREGKS